VAARVSDLLALIHPSAWNKNSQKFGCRILHKPYPESREYALRDHARRRAGVYM
jgi:hypothetical protein